MILDDEMPHFDFTEVHATAIRAQPADVFEAIKAVTVAEMPFVGLLFALRALPNRLLGRGRGLRPAATDPLVAQMLRAGFILLAEVPGREIVGGVVGKFWSVRGGAAFAPATADEFRRFAQPGYAKAVMSFLLEPWDGGTRLRTETRVLALDPASRRKFSRYWRIIHPGSALIRRMWLRAIKRRAEGIR